MQTIEYLEEKLYQLIFSDNKSKQIIGEFIDRYGFFATIHKHYRMNLSAGAQGRIKAIHTIIYYQHEKQNPAEYAAAIAFMTGIPKATIVSFGKTHGYETLLSENITIRASERQLARIQLLADFVGGFLDAEQKN